MSTTTVAAELESIARGRVAELVAVYNLPEPAYVHFNPDLWAGDEHGRALTGRPAPDAYLSVTVRHRTDVTPWAAFLDIRAETKHTIHEFDDGRWCAIWTEVARIRDWLPGCMFVVKHVQERWIDAPEESKR